MPPDSKRPRLLAPGDEASSYTPAVPSGAPSGLARGSYTGRDPLPALPRVEYLQGTSEPLIQLRKRIQLHVPPPSSSTSSSVLLPPPRKSGLPFTDKDNKEIVTYLSTGLPDILIAALMVRTPQEIQTQISLLIRRHEHGMSKGPQMRPPYTAEDYERILKMHRNGASAERIALALDRSTNSVMSHFKKHKPVWNAAGERVEALTLLRENEIDYKERVRAELAGPAAAVAAQLAGAPLVTQSGPPTASATPPLAETANCSAMPRPPPLAPQTVAKPPLASNASDPNVPALLPSRSDNSTQSVPDNPVPHHSGYLDHLPLWHDEPYVQAMSGLKRFLRLVKGSRSSRTRSASNS